MITYSAVFFDFDGVILDSVHVKTRAFASMFQQYGPDIEKAVVDYHLAHGGVSRFKKFEHYYQNLLRKPIDEKTMTHLSREFNRLALLDVLKAPFIPGVLETLEDLKRENIPCFVASGTPDEEIKYIVEERNLSPYFLEVHGSPKKKDEILLDIADRYDFNLSACLFIGDAMTDYEAAQKAGACFLGILSNRGFSPFPNGTMVKKSVVLS
jgi:HAD superfamily hydrolase (TIGR01549 family)